MSEQPLGGFDWTNRRKWIWRVSVFCMLTVAYCLWRGEDLRLYETAITAAFSLLGLLGGSYVFGAAWEHRSLVSGVTKQPPAGEQ